MQLTKNVEANDSHALNEIWLQTDIFRLKNEKSLMSFQENDHSDCDTKNSFCIDNERCVTNPKTLVVARCNTKIAQKLRMRALLCAICFIETFLSETLHWQHTSSAHKNWKMHDCKTCTTSKNTIKMNVFEKENQNECEQRNVPLRLKTENVWTQCAHTEQTICIVKIMFNKLRK